jgi:hypothetical protein
MLHASSFRVLNSGSERTGAARVRRPKPLNSLAARRHSFVPRLDVLEDRTVPSGGYVFQTIDPPLAAQLSVPALISNSGEIVGVYTDANAVIHGYLLSGGQYTTIDEPNAGTGAGQGTLVTGINASGSIVGAYLDANSVVHGFLLSGGRFTTLDDPNAGTGTFQGTVAGMINASGTIVGVYKDANSVEHGFLLSGGQYTTLDDPNAGTGAFQGTNAQGINALGVIVGYYADANSVVHGFQLSGGQYTTLDDPAGVLGSLASGLNDHGQVTGGYTDANGFSHGFVLSGGQYTTIDDPAGVLGNQADSINNSGKVVGAYTDANGVIHGSLATPTRGDSAGGSFALAIPDRLAPAQEMLSPPSNTSVAQGKLDQPPTRPEVSRIDRVFAEDRWSTAHQRFQPSRSGSESLPLDWLHHELGDDVAGIW